MSDLYLRASDEAAMKEALPGFLDADGEWTKANHQWALDPIGPVVSTPAVIDPETGEVSTPAELDERFHVNLRLLDEDLAESVPAEVQIETPVTPYRGWA